MATGVSIVRVILGVIGAFMLLGGLALAFSGIPGVFISAFWLIPSGAVLVIVALIEVSRYRSEHAELNDGESPGPGGGETGPIEPRFHRTDEVFVDPSSNRKMRVYADASTGERRYLAEG